MKFIKQGIKSAFIGLTGIASYIAASYVDKSTASLEAEPIDTTNQMITSYFEKDITISSSPILKSGICLTSNDEFMVNTETTNIQKNSNVLALDNSNFVICWQSDLNDGDGYGVYCQRYDESLSKLGSEFQVNDYTTSDQAFPRLAKLTNGNFVVTWDSDGQDGDAYGQYGKIYSSSGTLVKNEFQINTYTTKTQTGTNPAALTGGGFVSAWQSYEQDGDGYGVYAQLFDIDGNKVGTEFLVNTTTIGTQGGVTTLALSDGGFLIGWRYDDPTLAYDTYIRRYDGSANPTTGEIKVNTYSSDDQHTPIFTQLSNGNIVIFWTSNTSGDYAFDVVGQLFDSNLEKIGSEFLAHTNLDDDQVVYSVISLKDSHFAVMWESRGGQDGDDNGVYLQHFDSNANKLGEEVQINQYMVNDQSRAIATTLENGSYIVTWWDSQYDTNKTSAAILARSSHPVIHHAKMNIKKGETLLLSSYYISISDWDTPDNRLVITVSNVEHGQFERVDNQGIAITEFSYADIKSETIQFVHDGSDQAPQFEVMVSDSCSTTCVQSATTQLVENSPLCLSSNSEFLINTQTTGAQSRASIATLDENRFVICWQSEAQDGDGYGIFCQLYDDSLTKIGSEFQVNTYTTLDQIEPKIAKLKNGDFVVTWCSDEQDGSEEGIFAQRFDRDGNKLGSEFQANTFVTNKQMLPMIASMHDGGFVICWQSEAQDAGDNTGTFGIYGQRYNEHGDRIGNEFIIPETTTGPQVTQSITGLTDNGFIVAWSHYANVDDEYDIYARRFDEDNNPVGSVRLVNSSSRTNKQTVTEILLLENENIFITWQSLLQDGNGWGVYGRILDSNLNGVISEFKINEYTDSDQTYPRTTLLNNGDFIVVWHSNNQDGSGKGVYSQRYSATGYEIGNQVLVNQYTTGDQMFSTVASLESGSYIVVWDSKGYDDGNTSTAIVARASTPFIQKNELSINEDSRFTLSENELLINSWAMTDEELLITVTDVTNGNFEDNREIGVPITSFTYDNLKNGNIDFVVTGEDAPSYVIKISDPYTETCEQSATIDFTNINDAPELLIAKFTVKQGEDVILTKDMISASDIDTPDSDLIFTVKNVRFGRFEHLDNQGVAITTFEYQDILSEKIRFIHDGSQYQPSCEIKVSDGELETDYQEIDISYITPNDDDDNDETEKEAEENFFTSGEILTITGGAVSALVGYWIQYYFSKRHENKTRIRYPFAAQMRKSLNLQGADNFEKGDGERFRFWASNQKNKIRDSGLRYLLKKAGVTLKDNQYEIKIAKEISDLISSKWPKISGKINFEDLDQLNKKKIVDLYLETYVDPELSAISARSSDSSGSELNMKEISTSYESSTISHEI